MWELVAQGPYDNPAVDPQFGKVDELPHGTPVRFEFDTIPGAAYLLSIWDGSVREDLASRGLVLTNAGALGASKYRIDGYASSPGPVLLLLAVLAIVVGVAYIISKVSMWIDRGDTSVNTLLNALEMNLKVVVIGAAVVVAGLIAIRGLSE